ncbi:MAG: hypothetical protein JSU07_07625 [Bacteroidetes bacterium]|nr:hypothetical protein [Bacteroidota bacterium]
MFLGVKHFIWKKKYIFLFFSLFTILLTQRFLSERQHGLASSIMYDGTGYYTYLPTIFIYHDFTYSYYNKPENDIKPYYRPYLNGHDNGKEYNKYYCGTAICLLPFFVTGVIISAIAGTAINGYTDTFLMMVSVAALIYFMLSVYLLTKVGRYFKISEKISFIVALIFFFSTNLFHYTIQEPSMSHVYSFFAVSLFLYLFVKLIENGATKNLIYIGLSISLIVLIRPVNVVVALFTPFFFENFKSYFLFLKNIILTRWPGIILLIAIVLAAAAFQYYLFYLQTGVFYIDAYKNESFNFSNPELLKVLFGFRKGLFFYVPILFAVVALAFTIKNIWYNKLVFTITLAVFLYITSSWWCWWYGGGLSIRPIIDILPVFVIFSVFLLNRLNQKKQKIVLLSCIPFIYVSQIMAYQYSSKIMDGSYMDKEKYWDIFLNPDLASVKQNKIAKVLKSGHVIKSEFNDFETISDAQIFEGGYKSKKASFVGKSDTYSNTYSKGFGFYVKDLKIKQSFYIIAECDAKATSDVSVRDLLLAISIGDDNEIIMWETVSYGQFKKDKEGWAKMVNIIEVPFSKVKDNTVVKIFAMVDKGSNFIDNLSYKVVIPN